MPATIRLTSCLTFCREAKHKDDIWVGDREFSLGQGYVLWLGRVQRLSNRSQVWLEGRSDWQASGRGKAPSGSEISDERAP
jgi:hypothetical protein